MDRAQEHLHYLMDIAGEQLFILEEVGDVAETSAVKDVSRETSQETSQDVSQEVLSPSDDQSTSDRASPDPLTDDSKVSWGLPGQATAPGFSGVKTFC